MINHWHNNKWSGIKFSFYKFLNIYRCEFFSYQKKVESRDQSLLFNIQWPVIYWHIINRSIIDKGAAYIYTFFCQSRPALFWKLILGLRRIITEKENIGHTSVSVFYQRVFIHPLLQVLRERSINLILDFNCSFSTSKDMITCVWWYKLLIQVKWR
jgi:hypothetical protein